MLNPSILFHFTYCRLGAKHDFYSGGDSNFTGSRRRSQYFYIPLPAMYANLGQYKVIAKCRVDVTYESLDTLIHEIHYNVAGYQASRHKR